MIEQTVTLVCFFFKEHMDRNEMDITETKATTTNTLRFYDFDSAHYLCIETEAQM